MKLTSEERLMQSFRTACISTQYLLKALVLWTELGPIANGELLQDLSKYIVAHGHRITGM